MGWLAAGGGTLVAGYAVYNLGVRYLGQEARGEAREKPSQKADVVAARSSSLREKEAESVPISSAATPTISPPPPSFELSAPIVLDTQNPSPALNTPLTPSMAPPPLPSSRSSSPPRLKPPSMSAPPRPGHSLVRPPPSAAASLRVPRTKVLSNTHMQPASSTLGVAKKSSRQVTLKPGYSPLDWAALAKNPNNRLRGKDAPDHLTRVTPSQLKKQTGRKGKDAWTVYQGKVYNITPYLPFHPGGEAEIMKGAGRDAAKLFMEVHPWVNWDGMLAECLVGILVAEESAEAAKVNELDEMD